MRSNRRVLGFCCSVLVVALSINHFPDYAMPVVLGVFGAAIFEFLRETV